MRNHAVHIDDPSGSGSDSTLPHNITGLIGVMDGHQTDLRTGLPWQMVEVHEPVRLLCVVEVEPTLLQRLLEQNAGMKTFVDNGWIQLVAWSPSTDQLWEYVDGGFQLYRPESKALATVPNSSAYYRDDIDHLGCARVTAGLGNGHRRGGAR